MKNFKSSVLFLFAVALAVTGLCAQADRKPNVVIIYIDDLGWKDLGCYGSTFYETAHIDALAERGVLFTDAYAAANVCSPSRHALLTGQYPARSNFTNIRNWKPKQGRPLTGAVQDDRLDEAEIPFPEVFQEAGYRTGFIGKWDLNFEPGFGPRTSSHGFDHWEPIASEGGWKPWRIVSAEQDPKEVGEITGKSIAFIRDAVEAGEPFLLYQAHHTVHVELQATEALHDKYAAKEPGENGQRNPFMGAMIEQLDDSVGEMIEALEQLGVLQETIVVFSSDNGGQFDQFGKVVTRQTPLRGGKGDAYEGGVRVPLILAGPGIAGGKTIDAPVIQMDLYPTLVGRAGLSLPEGVPLDGVSLVPALDGEVEPDTALAEREAIYWHYPHYKAKTEPHSAIRMGDWKWIAYHENWLGVPGARENQLFNLEEDLGEQRNLAEARPEKAAELDRQLKEHLEAINAQMPTVRESQVEAQP